MAPERSEPSERSENQQNSNMDSSSSQNGNSNGASEPASATSVTNHLTQALRDLARGETTAAALEANLANLESKLDDILASLGSDAGGDRDEVAPEKEDGQVNGTTPDDKEKKADS